MRKVLMLAVVVIMVASTAYGQGAIRLYLDATGFAECNVTSDVGLLTINVVHTMTPGTTASQYKVQNNGTTLIYVADVNFFALVIGNSQAGVAISYGSCLAAPIQVQNVLYSGIGTSPVCSSLEVVADPAAPSGNIEAVNCSAVKEFPAGGRLTIKDDGSCPCANPVAETTWGKLKSLYE